MSRDVGLWGAAPSALTCPGTGTSIPAPRHDARVVYTRELTTGGEAREENNVSEQENAALVRRAWEEVNRKNLDFFDEVYAPTVRYHGPDGDIEGPAGLKEMVSGYLAAFPDMQITVEDVIASGDEAVARVTFRGMHQGELLGIAPTGKRIEISGMNLVRIENGQVVEEWENIDMLGLMQQIGAIPAPAEA